MTIALHLSVQDRYTLAVGVQRAAAVAAAAQRSSNAQSTRGAPSIPDAANNMALTSQTASNAAVVSGRLQRDDVRPHPENDDEDEAAGKLAAQRAFAVALVFILHTLAREKHKTHVSVPQLQAAVGGLSHNDAVSLVDALVRHGALSKTADSRGRTILGASVGAAKLLEQAVAWHVEHDLLLPTELESRALQVTSTQVSSSRSRAAQTTTRVAGGKRSSTAFTAADTEPAEATSTATLRSAKTISFRAPETSLASAAERSVRQRTDSSVAWAEVKSPWAKTPSPGDTSACDEFLSHWG